MMPLTSEPQLNIFDQSELSERALLDQLLDESRLYRYSTDYLELLKFISRQRNFAPFNAMLLQIQKPGLRFAASAKDWHKRFNRDIKPQARPLIILWPFGPVALVYDLLDTEGEDLPDEVFAFRAGGTEEVYSVEQFSRKLDKKQIALNFMDSGDNSAGSVQRLECKTEPGKKIPVCSYRIDINKNHPTNVQFCTLCHELAHIYLGHLGLDKLSGADRSRFKEAQQEIEAESVAYLICHRNDIQPKSQSYLNQFVTSDTTTQNLDLYRIMKAAGQIESLLGLNSKVLTSKYKGFFY